MENVIIIVILIVVLFFALRSSLKHFAGHGGCCGGGRWQMRCFELLLRKQDFGLPGFAVLHSNC